MLVTGGGTPGWGTTGVVAVSPVKLLGVALVVVVAGVVWPSVPVAVVTALRVREWCGDAIGGGAKLGT